MKSVEEFRESADGRWYKSSLSGGSGGCVYVAVVGDTVGIVETDDPSQISTSIVLTPLDNFRKFVQGAKDGEFDV